jgi:chromosome segregation ATPase
MPQGEQPYKPSSDERPSPLPTPETRVDAAHVRADEPPAAAVRVEPVHAKAVPVECTPGVTAQQVSLQAAQLASHLQRQQSAVDHRESELNARVAAMENQIRAARLWLDERHAEMAAQTAELERRERELTRRMEDLSGGTRSPPVSPGREQAHFIKGERPHAASSLETHRANLERAEALLSSQQAELERERRELADARAAFAETMQNERRKLTDEASRFNSQCSRTRQELKRQADDLAARSAALERMRGDVKRTQSEALELRLATEELWNRLCGSMAPAALTQSLAQTRLRLAEEYRLERSELAAEREEIQKLARQVARQHHKLVAEREEIQAWVKARHEELERYAGSLSAREREMDDRRAAFEDNAAAWRSERARLEQEIRRLLRGGNCEASVAAA